MIVVDASVLTNMLAYADDRGHKARAALRRDTAWAAPEHWKAEVFSALRGLVLGGEIDEPTGRRAIMRIPKLGIDHVSLNGMLPRMWALRTNISGYDAGYVALAERRNLTLLTADARLARSGAGLCAVELVA
jgi:predicted nucleic acid-binding protein